MNTTNILPEKLREFDYYKNKLPLFLQNSSGFVGHFKLWYDFLTGDNHTGISDNFDIILYLLDIFDEDYLEYLGQMRDSGATISNPYGNASDILDKLSSIFGVSRQFSCTYVNSQGIQTTEELSLNNEDFLVLIKCQIIRNYCEGTYSQIQSYYDSVGLNVFMKNGDNPATVTLYLLSFEDSNYSEDVKKMFLGGLLKIDSMGIGYEFIYTEIGDIFKWDGFGIHEIWDVGVWAA